MPLYVAHPVYRLKKSYRLIDQAKRRYGTIALIQRDRTCQDITQTAYAVVGTKKTLLLRTADLDPLPAADQSGNFTIPMRHPEAWFSDIEKARSIFNRLVRRGHIPLPEKVRHRRRPRRQRH
jgi:hypothetical protein